MFCENIKWLFEGLTKIDSKKIEDVIEAKDLSEAIKIIDNDYCIDCFEKLSVRKLIQ